MNIFSHFEGKLHDSLKTLDLNDQADLSRISVEPPRDPSHGDLSTNAAMVLAKTLSMNPRELAAKLVETLKDDPEIESMDIAGPGFINFTLPQSLWQDILKQMLSNLPEATTSKMGEGEKINIEYVSANPTGPMHVGHCRGAIFGDALASLFEATGYDVTREYYINDAGAQVDVLARSAYLRYLEALGEIIGDIPEGLYPGDYLIPVGKQLAQSHGDALTSMEEEEWLPLIRQVAIDAMMDLIREDLELLNIKHDVFFSEKTLSNDQDLINDTINELDKKGLIYEGHLPPPKGQLPDDWEDREQTLFKATDFGDDVDRALKKSDGSYTYFAADIAYHKDKIDRGYSSLINVWGADHGGYIKRMNAAISALSEAKVKFEVKICQLVRLFKNGEPFKMSKRAGDFITLRDVVEEVGSDVTRFMMLFRKNDAPLDFDFAKVMDQSRENPVFYVQYAHARINSVFKQAAIAVSEDRLEKIDITELSLKDAQSDLLTDDAEIDLIKLIATYPRILEQAASAQEPHRIAFYLYDLASQYHSLWNKGKEKPNLRFIIDNDVKLTRARLALLFLCQKIIAAGLNVLGVIPVKEMK